MKQKLRFNVKVKGWVFPLFHGLVWHSGKFWFNGEPLKEVYNNGSKAILIGGTKHGLTKLRKQAQICEVELMDDLPF